MNCMEFNKNSQKFYIETYGCQMNVVDSEVVISIMQQEGFSVTEDINKANIILINTCSVRENAEQRVWGRLNVFKQIKNKKPGLLVAVIGCMAERLKEKLIEKEKFIDLVIGPDSYRNLPQLLHTVKIGQKVVNVILSDKETYADINPVRMNKNNVTAFVSIMRGCNNLCSYCVVPYTRGRERSKNPDSIICEIRELINKSYREVTLLGQNVDSYKYKNQENEKIINFAKLLEMVAKLDSGLRIRFSTSHPKDMSDEVLYTMARYKNICNSIHLPLQSGSSRILKLMNRGYTREWYMDRIKTIKKISPGCSISTDIMTGFCAETEEDHQETLSLMKWAEYDFAYMFKYSERPGTKAAKKLEDDVPEKVKLKRLTEIINLQNELSQKSKIKDLNNIYEVLIEGTSKKSDNHFFGRNSQNKVVVFPKENFKIGNYVSVKITDCTSATLIGKAVK